MAAGIRATVEFTTPGLCPLVDLSTTTGAAIDSVSRSVCPDRDARSVTEFAMDADCDPEEPITRIFAGGTNRYRYTHEPGVDCPCECLGCAGCPVVRYTVREGTLTLVFHAADYEQLQDVIGRLRERYPDVEIKRFIRSPGSDETGDGVFVDRRRLTDRQYEILELAHENGYFARPREANATELAADLDIDPSTFREHLRAAQSKLFEDIVRE